METSIYSFADNFHGMIILVNIKFRYEVLKRGIIMKKLLSSILIVSTLFLSTTPVFAIGEKTLTSNITEKTIEQTQRPVEREVKKESEEIEEVNQSVVAVIGKNTKY